MAEYSGRLSRSRQSSRATRQGSGQDQNNLGIVLKTSVGGSFGPTDGTLVANIGQNLDRDLNNGPLATDLLPQPEEGMNLFPWCEQCGTNTDGDCLIHGTVITISDNKLPSRARLSLPSILSLQQVNEDGGAEGVFAKNSIQPRTQFGPLEAPPLPSGVKLPPGVFDIRVLKSNSTQEQLDLSQEEACNWMMFVRPSLYDQDTNLVAYQQADRIYYISTKPIAPKTELRVWYYRSYGQQLGKAPLPPSLPSLSILPEMGEEQEELHTLESQTSSMVVMGTRQTAETSKHTCTSCNLTFRSLPLLWEHNCRVLEDSQTVDTSSRPARRKGRPRKVAGAGKRGRPAPPVAAPAAANTTILPSVTTLIKTEIKTEVPMPDSTVPDPQQEVVAKKRGRPKGSKNKPPAEGEVRPPRKPPVAVKRQRPKLNCSHCDRSFYSQEQHRVHEAEHTGVKPYVCQFEGCGKGFGSNFKFRRHSLVHAQPQDRKCPFCDRCFNRVDHLKNHVATHNSNRQHWSCEKCGKKYLYHVTYEFHMATHDAKDAPQLICRICSQSFTSREALIQHVNSHNRYKPDLNRSKSHKCSKCDKTFTTTKDVKRHMVTHTKDRSFLCDMCPQTFARKDHLRRHKRSNHKDEGLQESTAVNAMVPRTFKTETYLPCEMETDPLKSQENGSLVKLMTDKQQMLLDAHPSKVVLMQVHQQQQQSAQQQQQQLSLLSPSATPAAVHMAINQHQQQQHEQQQQQQQQQHQILLQPGSYITALPAGTEAQAIEVIADGNDQYNPTLPLKTNAFRFSSGQVPSTAQSAPSPSLPIAPNLRQMLQQQTAMQQAQQPQQQQQQVQQLSSQAAQPQAVYSQQDNTAATTIMSMLTSSSRADSLLELAGKGQTVYTQDTGGQLKSVPAQWVTQDASTIQTTSDSGDHCYATGVATTNADGGLKLSSFPSLTGKVLNSVVPISDESLRMLQNCQLATGVGGNTPSTSIQGSSGSSLQASWEIPELVNVHFPEMITSLSQPSIINLPVTVNVPITEGSVSVTASVTLSQST